jgi:hypothetical protein
VSSVQFRTQWHSDGNSHVWCFRASHVTGQTVGGSFRSGSNRSYCARGSNRLHQCSEHSSYCAPHEYWYVIDRAHLRITRSGSNRATGHTVLNAPRVIPQRVKPLLAQAGQTARPLALAVSRRHVCERFVDRAHPRITRMRVKPHGPLRWPSHDGTSTIIMHGGACPRNAGQTAPAHAGQTAQPLTTGRLTTAHPRITRISSAR